MSIAEKKKEKIDDLMTWICDTKPVNVYSVHSKMCLKAALSKSNYNAIRILWTALYWSIGTGKNDSTLFE